jgi:hypothetical protein
MFKKILITLGLAKAPMPVKSYLVASSFVGTLPALAFVAWKYREKIVPVFRRAKERVASHSSSTQRTAQFESAAY